MTSSATSTCSCSSGRRAGSDQRPPVPRLYEFAIRGIEALNDGEYAVTSDQATLRGRLRLSIPPAFEPWWALLGAFRARYPDIELEVHASERRLDLIEDGVDVALRVGPVVDDTLVARRIATYRHVLVAGPGLLARFGTPGTPADLQQFPCAVWSSAIGVRSDWQLGEQRLRPPPLLATNDYLHLRAVATADEAVAELPPFLARPLIAAGALVALLPGHPLPEQTVNLLYVAHRYPSTVVRTYLDFCRTEAAPLLDTQPDPGCMRG